MSNHRSKSRGFSLLEVIVALAIMGLSVTVLLRIFAGVSATTRLADDYYQALQIAETQMALMTATDNPLGVKRGQVNDYYHWQSFVEVYKPGRDNPLFDGDTIFDPQHSITPYHFQVTVAWGVHQKRQVELSTVRLGVSN